MQSNRSSGTNPELVLARLLRKKIVVSDLPGKPDFVYSRQKLAVFVHGCWWHRCPRENYPLPKTHRAYWKRKFARNVERDQITKAELESMGWRVIEVWEHSVRESPGETARKIQSVAGVQTGDLTGAPTL